MKKNLISLIVALILIISTAFAAISVDTVAADIPLTGDVSTLKIGAVLIGDENEGYSYAHIDGINRAAAALGIDPSQITFKYNIGEESAAYDAGLDLADAGCSIIFYNSYGHQTYALQVAQEVPEVQIVSMTGDMANAVNLPNYANVFNHTYESRYISGVVAGEKIKEMVENGELPREKTIKIGYVGAYPYAEVVSGYTAFFLGVRSQYPDVEMEVMYTNSWSDIMGEAAAANSLIADGCVIISQHSDTTGPASAVEAARESGVNVYCVGYNISMRNVAPTSYLTSASNDWEVYYEFALKMAANGEFLPLNWSAGYAKDAVYIAPLGSAVVNSDVVENTIAQIKNNELKVFDTTTFTVDGQEVVEAFATDTDGDFVNDADNAIINGEYKESYFQSAPSFSLRIDGITELN